MARTRAPEDKGKPLEAGNPRRLTDARCAWRKMDAEQRKEFLAWLQREEGTDRRDGPRRLVSRLGSGRRGGTDPRKPVVTTARDVRVTAPRLPSDWPSPDAVEAFADAYRSWLGE